MLINDHKQWLYKGDSKTGKIFEAGDEIPDGWVDRPNSDTWDNKPVQPEQFQEDIMKMNKPELLEFAKKHNIEVDDTKQFFAVRADVKKALDK